MINIQINSTELKDDTELSISEVEPGIISLFIYDPDDRHNGKYISVYTSNLQKAIDIFKDSELKPDAPSRISGGGVVIQPR